MQKLTKRIISGVLCILMLTPFFPCALFSAYAAVSDDSGAAAETKFNIQVAGHTDASGTASGSVTESNAKTAIDAAKTAEKNASSALIVLDFSAAGPVKSLRLTIPASVFSEIAIETGARLRLESALGSLTFDSKALVAVFSALKGLDINIGIKKSDDTAYSLGLDSDRGNRPVYIYSVSAGQTQVYNLVGGTVSASIPYALQSGEDKSALLIYSVDENGNSQIAAGGFCESEKALRFPLSSLSTYAVGYKKVPFEDVGASDWYSEAVTYLAARKITGGVDGTHFGPEYQLTRGQFIVMLLKAYGIPPLSASADNFSDAGKTYYTGYIAAAKKLGITSGTGSNTFSPESPITRQDMFTVLYRTLKTLDRVPPAASRSTVDAFSDGGSVSSYASESMNALIGAGIIKGSEGYLRPNYGCTRAEMAQVLYRTLSF